MYKILTLLLVISFNSYSTTLNEAISQVVNETNYENKANEVIIEQETYNSSISSAKQTIVQYTPTPYLFFTYSNPFQTHLDGTLPNNITIPPKFITGLVQKNYGFAIDYNIASIPQAIKKIQSMIVVKAVAKSTMEGKESEFYYNLSTIYLELYKTQATLSLQEKIYEIAKIRYTEIQKNTQYGMASKKDLLMSESDLLKAEMNLENYKNLLQNAQEKYIQKFKIIHTDLTIPDTSLFSIANNIEELRNKILNNQNIIATNKLAQSYKIESNIEKLNLLPKVTLTYRQLFNNPDPSLGFPNYSQSIFSVNANFNLLNINSYFASKKYSHEEKKKKAESKLMKSSYETEAVNIWHETQHQEQMIIVLTKVVKNLQEVYLITKNEVRTGLKSYTEELLKKQEYQSAELELLNAKIKKAQNIQRLKFLTGQNTF